MKINNKTIKLVVLMVVLAAVFVATKVVAASSFPEIMSGSTTVTLDGQTIYAGMAGNYAVLNNDQNGSYGFNISSSVGLFRPGCLDQTFTPIFTGLCFNLGTGSSGAGAVSAGRLMTSRTTVNGALVYELPALLFSGLNISGDVSGNLGYLLKFWGNNLYRGTDSPEGAAWNLGAYVLNPDAQQTWSSAKFGQYSAKLASLAGSGTVIPNTTLNGAANLYLQAAGTSITTDSAQGDAANYPEGKTWVISNANLAMNTSFTFHGKGTIIIKSHDLTVGNNINFKPDPSDPTARLGIIVLDDGAVTPTGGNCTFSGNNDPIRAMMLCTKTFTVTTNASFKGSFVANNFGVNTGYSVNFEYDPVFDDSQPPGFKNLVMPGSAEVGNQ